jgi:phospholipid/cholesterol/gamma-HCH transport system substrate-binding protein
MPTALKVGIFAVVCLVTLGYFILKIEDLPWSGRSGRAVDVAFDNVAGLDDKASVRVAGVRVGRVDGIALRDGRARVTLRLEAPVRLGAGASARLANLGLLGEQYVELVPGAADGPELPAGTVLAGTAPMSFDQAMEKLNQVADSVQGLTGSLRGEGQETTISRLIANLEATSSDIRELVAANRQQVSATLDNFRRFSDTLASEMPKLADRLQSMLREVEDVVAENRGNLKDSLGNIKDLTARIQGSIDNLETISGKIASGEGTIGKLVNSDEAHRQLVGTLETIDAGVKDLSNVLGRVGKLKLDVGLQSAFLSDISETRSTFRVDLDPPSDRFYRVEVVQDPRGSEHGKTTSTTVTNPDGSSGTTTTRVETREDTTTISALFGFPLRTAGAGGERPQAALWAGLIEGNFGGQIDYPLFRDRLLVSFEAFDFSRQGDLDPHLRLTSEFRLTRNLRLFAGYDDPLAKPYRSVFVGAGIRWSDDDLKYLMGSVPRF